MAGFCPNRGRQVRALALLHGSRILLYPTTIRSFPVLQLAPLEATAIGVPIKCRESQTQNSPIRDLLCRLTVGGLLFWGHLLLARGLLPTTPTDNSFAEVGNVTHSC
jgi:hypothetical protein